ncbi:AAA family ATPase [Candidatus Woesearchaeota archaeon]|jgi:DNA polymerase III delta prime subunit|nr:AAA family ATPase [Candidatus Woesearchaeota archaeon]
MNEIKHSLWVEKYRPSSMDTYIGNEHLKSKVSIYLESGDLPHLLLFGRAGTGKTTLAKLLVNNIDCDYLYINASDENSVDVVRDKVKNFASTLGFQEMKIIILDECDYITPNAQAALRNLMETFSKHCRFILTCNYVERIIDPIQSRCQSFQIIPPDRKQVAQHLSNILDNENVKYELDNVVTIVNGGYPDIRRVINGAQRQVVNNELVIDKNTIIQNDYKLQVLEILEKQDKKNSFKNIRQLLADSKVTDFSDLFRLLFDTVDDWGKGHIAECILILSKYQQSDAVVVDKEINIMAMFVEIIGKIK